MGTISDEELGAYHGCISCTRTESLVEESFATQPAEVPTLVVHQNPRFDRGLRGQVLFEGGASLEFDAQLPRMVVEACKLLAEI